MPEFSGKQQKLKDFFKKSEKNANISHFNASGNRTKGNTKLVNESKSGIKEISADKIQQKSSDKRHAQSTLRSQAKRLKTNTGASQGKIFQFFEKKNTKSKTDSNKQTDCSSKVVADSLANTNESDSGISEERSETVPHLNIHNVELCSSLESTNTSSQTSTSSACSDSDYSTKSSSQNATQSSASEETQQARSQNYSKEQRNSDEKSAAVVSSWKNILKGLPPAPLCSGHKEPCVLRTVKNKGANHGKQFYCCARPQGHSTNKEARCNDFKWLKK
jgi:AP endonuclease-2